MAPRKPVIVRLSRGEIVGLASPAIAKSVYPDGEILRYADGTPYEEDAKAAPKKKAAAKKDEADA